LLSSITSTPALLLQLGLLQMETWGNFTEPQALQRLPSNLGSFDGQEIMVSPIGTCFFSLAMSTVLLHEAVIPCASDMCFSLAGCLISRNESSTKGIIAQGHSWR
jgi:hypothetical protein